LNEVAEAGQDPGGLLVEAATLSECPMDLRLRDGDEDPAPD
jgi:hypothetical protein